jgi:DNA invertase Pin-like site-specific DNA recombinase
MTKPLDLKVAEKNQTVGYVRVSSPDQNPARQLDGITVDRLFADFASGKDRARPRLAEMIEYVRDGDLVIVHSMDRLARNLVDLRDTVDDLTARGITIRFVRENLTFNADHDPMAYLMLHLLGAVAQFERDLIRERQREGIAIAKARGIYKGRRAALAGDAIPEVIARIAAGESKCSIARFYKVHRQTIYRIAARSK